MNDGNHDPFDTTRWSLVLRSRSDSDRRESLNELFSIYWVPVFGYIRRRVISNQDAEDLTQGFFTRILERDYLAAADPARGKLRAFLLTDLKFFLSNERAKASALKRKGAFPDLSFDLMKEVEIDPLGEGKSEDPDQWFDRNWALEVFERAMEKVRQSYEKRGKEELFDLIKPCLEEVEHGGLGAIAEKLGRDTNYVKQQVFRLRERFRKAFRQIVADTVESEDEIDAEIRYLLLALR